jgi:hypothetical protein
MKKFIPAVGATIFAALLVVPLSGCFGGSESATPAPAPKQATNVELIEVPGGDNGFNSVVVFDIERDGRILTCTTKAGYNSGVSCLEKAKQ